MSAKCEQCYWFEQCGEEQTCEYFDPLEITQDDLDALILERKATFTEQYEEYLCEIQ